MKFSLASVIALGLFGVTTINAPMSVVAQETETLNYIGVGVGSDGVTAISKFAINNNLSLRPMAIGSFDDFDGTFLLPLTYDLKPINGNLRPYVGAGIGGNTEDGGDVGGVLTVGVDYPINRSVIANGSVNYDLFGDHDVRAILGVGYNLNK